MPRPTPTIDGRDMEAILRGVRALAPSYAPEWDASAESGAGAALLKVYAKLLEGLVRRLNDVPFKNYVAFLDMLGVRLQPAQPARAPLTFFLSAGAKTAVPVPRRSQAAAAPEGGGDPVIFETERAILATPARLVAVYSVVPARDRVFDHAPALVGPKATGTAALFSESNPNLQEHGLYLAHDDLLNVNSPVRVSLTFETPAPVSTRPRDGERQSARQRDDLQRLLALLRDDVNWQYYAERVTDGVKEKNWFDFETAAAPTEMGPAFGGVRVEGDTLALVKDNADELKQTKVNGVNSRWIRGVVKAPLTPDSPLAQLRVTGVGLTVEPYDPTAGSGESPPAGVLPDGLVYNDIPLDEPTPGAPVLAFGPRPRQGDALYIASRQAFSKKRTPVRIYFNAGLRRPPSGGGTDTTPELIVWEYWNGKGWSPVTKIQSLDARSDVMRFDATEKFSKGGEVAFEAPEDIAETRVAGLESLWVRARIAFGDYGQERVVAAGTAAPPPTEAPKGGEGATTTSTTTTSTPPPVTEFEISTAAIHPPEISYVRIVFSSAKPPESVFTLNNLEYFAPTPPTPGSDPVTFAPFVPLEDERQALHLGFDRAPLKGPISVFFSLAEQLYTEETMPRVAWEYLRVSADGATEWARLPVEDGTRHLTESGTAEFIGPEDFTRASRFGAPLYWVCAVDTEDKFGSRSGRAAQLSEQQTTATALSSAMFKERTPFLTAGVDFGKAGFALALTNEADKETEEPEDECGCRMRTCDDVVESLSPQFVSPGLSGLTFAPLVRGVYPNTAWASQAETISGEIVGSSTGDAGQRYALTKKPVTEEAIWVDEFGTLTDTERKALAARPDVETDERQNDAGVPVAFWVRWRRVEDLGAAGPSDRVYQIDQTFGLVEFGDGRRGRVPPIGRDNVRASYRAGGGARGNVAAGAIKTMRTTIPSVEKVANPVAAGGGADTEAVESALDRGSQSIRNRGRAVAAEDFEWLTRASSRSVARVKCLPTFNDQGEYETGWVTVIVVPGTGEARPTPSPQLSLRVERYLSERAANVVSFPRRVKVSGPVYVEVKVTAVLFPTRLELAPAVEAEALRRLAAFLHPLTGGYAGTGWDFGRLPCLSDFYALLEGVEGVDHVEAPSMSLQVLSPLGVPEGPPRAVTEDRPLSVEMPQFALVSSGEHKVTVRALL